MIINASVSSAGALAVALAGGAFTATGYAATASLGAGSLSITETRTTSKIAPAAAYLTATSISGFSLSTAPAGTDYEPEFHEITYIWTVRTSPLSLETPSILNLPTAWKDPNVACGKEVFFAFNDAGTYDVDLWAVDETGITGTATYQIVVAGADASYPTTDTICYSETDFTGAPSGASQVGSFAALQSAIDAKSASDDLRILFRGGTTIDIGDQIDTQSVASVALGSFGAGGRATVLIPWDTADTPIWSLIRSPTNDQKFYDLNLAGGWDAVRERGLPGVSPVAPNWARDTLFHRCKLTGLDQLYTPHAAGDILYGLSETEITEWRNFGLFGYAHSGGSKYYGFSACSIHQHEDAPQGANTGLADQAMSNSHGPVRLETAQNVYMGMCDFFSRNGWSGGFGYSTDQPCVRHNTNAVTGVHTVMDRCACEGGYQVIKMKGQNQAEPATAGNYVFDRLIVLGTPETETPIDCQYGGTTIRNMIAIETNVKKNSYGLNAGVVSFGIDPGEETTASQDSPVAVYNSTIISLLSTANNQDGDVLGTNENVEGIVNGYTVSTTTYSAFTNFTDNNNVWHAPNQDAPVTTFAPLDLATQIPGFAARFKGVLESSHAYFSNFASDVVDTASFTIAYSNLLDTSFNSTNQAYWQGLDAGDTKHAMNVSSGPGRMFAEDGKFSVSFDASVVTITNTSGETWASGAQFSLKLDQSSNQVAIDATYSITGQTIPLARPTSGSSAIGTGDTGRKAYDDFELTVRPASGADKGAVEAT